MGNAIKKFLSIFADSKMVGQYSHFAWGYGVVLTCAIRGHGTMAAAIFLAVAAVKEFYIDKHFEYQQTALDNTIDLASYALGVGVALLAHHFI